MLCYAKWSLMTVLLVSLRSEVAMTTQVNVAYRKPAYQRDTEYGGDPGRAVDGNPNGKFFDHPCTHTLSTSNTWWMVDLLQPYNVKTIRIANRVYPGHVRLLQFYIYVSMEDRLTSISNMDQFPEEECLYREKEIPYPGLQTLNCTRTIRGRFVYLWKPGNLVLTICEFEVLVPIELTVQCRRTDDQRLNTVVVKETTALRPPTLLRCSVYCLSKQPLDITHVQVDKSSRLCQCVEYNLLNNGPPDTVPDQNYEFCL